MTFTSFDRAIERLARNQEGTFTLDQVRRLGGTLHVVKTRLRSGMWIRMASGLYSLPGVPTTWQHHYKAAQLSVPGAVLCGLAAAKLHGLEGFRTVRAEILVPYTSNVRHPFAIVHRGFDVPTTTVQGIKVTSVAQTLFDVTRRTRLDRLERGMDAAILSGKVTVEQLEERRDAFNRSRKPGIGVWRALVKERSSDAWAPAESELEAELWKVALGIPSRPRLLRQAELPWWKRGSGRTDILVVDWRLLLEADGRVWHARLAAFDDDRWRDNLAQAHGHRVMRFTHTHLTYRPNECRELIEDAGRWTVTAA